MIGINAETMYNVRYGLGYLYNWYAVSYPLSFVDNWKVPEYSDFEVLFAEINNDGAKLKSTLTYPQNNYGWSTQSMSYLISSNISRFNALPAGYCSLSSVDNINLQTVFYSSTTDVGETAKTFTLDYVNGNITYNSFYKRNGGSIRLLMINTSNYKDGDTVTIDGKIYHTVRIGTQVWLAQNLAATHYSNGEAINKNTNSWGAITYPVYRPYYVNESMVWI